MDQNQIVLLVLCKLSKSNLSVFAPFLFILCRDHVGSTGGLDNIEQMNSLVLRHFPTIFEDNIQKEEFARIFIDEASDLVENGGKLPTLEESMEDADVCRTIASADTNIEIASAALELVVYGYILRASDSSERLHLWDGGTGAIVSTRYGDISQL